MNTIEAILAATALIGAGAGGVLYVEDRIQYVEQETVKTLQQFRCAELRKEIERYEWLESKGQLTADQKTDLQWLRRQYERDCGNSS